MLDMIARLDGLCAEYQAATGDQTNRRLFQWMARADGHYDRAAQAHAALSGRLTNARIGTLLDDVIEATQVLLH